MKTFKNRQSFILLILILSVFLIAGCGGDGGGGTWDKASGTSAPVVPVVPGTIIPGAICTIASGPTIPEVDSSNPTSGNLLASTSTTGVAGGGKLITATFSMPMDPLTINSGTAPLTFTVIETVSTNPVAGTVAMNATNTIATFTTVAALLPDTEYTVSITTDAESATNVAMACSYEWNFRTVIPPATGLAPVDPGLLDPFAIASAGGITDIGFTNVNGDVVLDPNDTCNAAAVGAADDFGANCNAGANTIINNAGDRVITPITLPAGESTAVMVEMNTKWISISPAGTPGATFLGCGTIGTAGGAGLGIGCAGNATLPPDVYMSATSTSIDITGNLTLDAGGDPDAVWIFQAPSTVIANVGSQIILIGGAKASNVWWFVGSSATLFTNSVFNGNILASASITMQNGATSCGRLLSGAAGAGAFTFDTNVVSVPGHPNGPASCQ